MLISTITLNPAVDKTYYVSKFSVNSVNRAWQVKTNAGGKGINFSASVAECSVPTKAYGFLGEGGDKIEVFLKEKGIETDFVRIPSAVRTNIKICDTEVQTYTDLNESGSPIEEISNREMLKKAELAAQNSEFIYMGGSLPLGISDDTYAKIIRMCKKNGAVTVVDTSGMPLRIAAEELPDIIKPNREEAEELCGISIKSISDAEKAAAGLYKKGIKNVLLTLGGNGAVCAGESGVFRVYPLCVSVKSTVGAGDSFLAGFVYGKTLGAPFSDCLKYAMSFSAAKIQKDGTDIPTFDELVSSLNSVKLEKIG